MARMEIKKLKKIRTELELDEILSEIQTENDEFMTRAPEYKKKLEKKETREGQSFHHRSAKILYVDGMGRVKNFSNLRNTT